MLIIIHFQYKASVVQQEKCPCPICQYHFSLTGQSKSRMIMGEAKLIQLAFSRVKFRCLELLPLLGLGLHQLALLIVNDSGCLSSSCYGVFMQAYDVISHSDWHTSNATDRTIVQSLPENFSQRFSPSQTLCMGVAHVVGKYIPCHRYMTLSDLISTQR